MNLEDTLATFFATIPRRALAEGLQNGLPEMAGPLQLRQRVARLKIVTSCLNPAAQSTATLRRPSVIPPQRRNVRGPLATKRGLYLVNGVLVHVEITQQSVAIPQHIWQTTSNPFNNLPLARGVYSLEQILSRKETTSMKMRYSRRSVRRCGISKLDLQAAVVKGLYSGEDSTAPQKDWPKEKVDAFNLGRVWRGLDPCS